MPDDDRTRRRLGDETKGRIADLASGWTVESPKDPPAAPEPTPEPAPRNKPRTIPPPPPGSPERKALEDQIVATTATKDDPTDERTDREEVLPAAGYVKPIEARATSATGPNVIARPNAITGSPPIADRSKPTTAPPPVPTARPKVPTGSTPVATKATGPVADARPKPPTGPPPVPAARTKLPTGSNPVATIGDARSKPTTAPPPVLTSARSGATGPNPIAARASATGPSATGPSATDDARSKPSSAPPLAATGSGALGDARSKSSSAPPALGARSNVAGPHAVDDARSKSSSAPPPLGATGPLGDARSKPSSASRPVGGERGSGANLVGDARTKLPAAPPPAAGEPDTGSHLIDVRLTPASAPRSNVTGGNPIDPRSAWPEIAEPPRSKPISTAPATSGGPKYPRAGYNGPQQPFATDAPFARETHTPAVIVDDSITDADPVSPVPIAASISDPRLLVPVGEFGSGVKTLDARDEARIAQAQLTMKRDAAEALLKIPDVETPVEALLDDDVEDDDDDDDDDPRNALPARGDQTTIDAQTAKFERGDPTQDHRPDADATEIQMPSSGKHPTGGTLRTNAMLRRKRGLYGDVRYVFTVVFGVRRSRQELAELEHRQGLRQTSRRRHLVTLGRTAVIMDSFDHPALGRARDQMQAIEDERSKHAGAVAAADAELDRVRRDRDVKAKQYVAEVSEADAELAVLTKKVEPLEKDAAGLKKRAQDMRDSLQRVEKQIADTEALLTSVKAEKLEKAKIQSDLATYKADRVAVRRDEPAIAAELDALNPRIAAIEANRAELTKKKIELEKSEAEDQRRTAELLEAIAAKRKVVERAAAEAEVARDNTLFELGERLYVDRPKVLTAQLSPIDQIDLELGESDRRVMELREILSNVDKAKFARGSAMIILALGMAGSFVIGLLYALL